MGDFEAARAESLVLHFWWGFGVGILRGWAGVWLLSGHFEGCGLERGCCVLVLYSSLGLWRRVLGELSVLDIYQPYILRVELTLEYSFLH